MSSYTAQKMKFSFKDFFGKYDQIRSFLMSCFCGMVDQRKTFTPYFHPGPLSEILTIANLCHSARRIWTYAESEFRLCWIEMCSSDNHYTTVGLVTFIEEILYRKLRFLCSVSICSFWNLSKKLTIHHTLFFPSIFVLFYSPISFWIHPYW